MADTEDDRPLGHRFLLPDGTVALPADVEDADSEDEEPLGKRFSRMSLPHITAGPLLQVPAEDEGEPSEADGIRLVDSEDGSNDALRHRFTHTSTLDEDEDEDEKPLGARFSTMIANADEVPLALHRLSLAPQIISAAAVPTATLRPVDDDGKSIVTDSDDAPLGLRTGAAQTGPQGFYPDGMPLPSSVMMMPAPHIYPGAMSYPSLPMPPPPLPFYSTPSAPFFPGSMPLGQFPVHAPPLGPPPPPPPPMQFAVAEMQMQAALQTSQAAATFGGAGASIDRWRKSVQP